MLEKGEQPALAAARELQDETGFEGPDKMEFLGCLAPDTGRLENKLWCYSALDVISEGTIARQLDPGVESVIYSVAELCAAVKDGNFEHAVHIAVIGLALLKGHIPAESSCVEERIHQLDEPTSTSKRIIARTPARIEVEAA